MKNREKISNNGIITEVELGVEPMTLEKTGSGMAIIFFN
jgi:hypothetical protein